MAISITDLKNKCENANNALTVKGRSIQLDIRRSGVKGYNIYLIKVEGSSTVAVGLTGKEANIWLDGFFTSLYN